MSAVRCESTVAPQKAPSPLSTMETFWKVPSTGTKGWKHKMKTHAGAFTMWMKMKSVWALQYSQTWQAWASLHSVSFLPITKPADVEAERFDVINTLRHHQVLVHQVAAVRARLGQKDGTMKESVYIFKTLLVFLERKSSTVNTTAAKCEN